MKILHITDTHGTVKSPEGRTDIYYLSFLKKMYELKYVIKQEKINLIIHTGDLFHSPRVSDKFTGQLAEIIKSYNIPMYVVPGNHDIDGYTIQTLDQTKLGLLYKTGVVYELDRNHGPIQLKSQKENLLISVAGQEYYKDIDNGNMHDFEMQSTNNNASFNILAIHGYLCDKPQHPNIKHTLCDSIITDADVILTGHFHESFVYHGTDFSVYNPGSMMRVEQTSYNQNHLPQYGILEINNDNGIVKHTYTLHSFQVAEPSDKVFDYTIKNQKKKTLITLENFKNSIANTNLNSNLNTSIENIINDVSKNLSMNQEIIDKTVDVYHNALNNSPDKLEVQQGYITDVSRKIIKHVEIKNFQSHEYTIIEFKDGLNTIIGESNSGKTSILRAIRWCLDNDPKGSDFITTGRDDCSVTVVFDDGTSIIRKRTRNDSGTYDVVGKTIQPDGTASKWIQTYKGFANNLPIEIMNIHQMPKVNLTKDISTHLNMMSQLDGPFLIAESPQVKAAIIGRLTGTQIIDLAIKETNREVLNNSKSIKIWSEEKQDKENELLKYQDLPYYEEYLKLYRSISCYISNLFNIAQNVCKYFNDLMDCISHYEVIKLQYEYISGKVNTCQNMIYIKQYIANQLEMFNVYEDYKNTQNNVDVLQRRLKLCIIIVSLKQFVENIELKLNSHVQSINCYSKILSLQQQMKTHTDNINNINNSTNIIENMKCYLNSIYSCVNVLSKDIDSTNPVYTKFIACSHDSDMYKNNISEYETKTNSIIMTIDSLIKEQEKLIKENNICPCCGQKITTNKQVHNINNFMKGQSI